MTPESPIATLERWEDAGALWRARSPQGEEAVVELCTCHGEVVEVLRSRDPALVRYLTTRPSSEAPASPR